MILPTVSTLFLFFSNPFSFLADLLASFSSFPGVKILSKVVCDLGIITKFLEWSCGVGSVETLVLRISEGGSLAINFFL